MSRFVINRKDRDVDPIELESEGLTIGRVSGNDLTLNHPAVSRTHSGIKKIENDYWIFNLSGANGTLLNGESVDQTPIADGDVIQIGPFYIYPHYMNGGLRIDVETDIKTSISETTFKNNRTVMLQPDMLNTGMKADGTPRPPGGGKPQRERLATSMYATALNPKYAEALRVFWDKRMREAGKLSGETPLHPIGNKRLGKAQFNWYPTLDLKKIWSRSIFLWGTLSVFALAALSVFAYKDAYSPGPLSNPHIRSRMDINPAIAKEINGNSCTACHTLTRTVVQACADCHTTQAFRSEISDKHVKVGLTCINCHTEHKGRDFRPALLADNSCVGCHNNSGKYISPLTNKALKTPHGGTFGYPVQNGKWKEWGGITQTQWIYKKLPGLVAQFSPRDQFHLVHVGGRSQGRALCTDCHTSGFAGDDVKKGVRESCASCHSITTEQNAGPLCASCHAQHTEDKNLRTTLRRMTQRRKGVEGTED